MEENKDKEEYPIGCLVEFKDLTYIQRDLLIKLLSSMTFRLIPIFRLRRFEWTPFAIYI